MSLKLYCFEHRTMYIMPSGECIEIKPGEKTSNSLHQYNCKVNYFVYIIKCRTDIDIQGGLNKTVMTI